MNYETIKSFILIVLIGISLLLSFILWSYQPNYENVYDTSYVNEVDIGGIEKTKNELIEPTEIIFRNGTRASSFINPVDRHMFYNDLASWVLYDYRAGDSNGRPDEEEMFVEIIFPSAIPADVITNLFTFDEEFDPPNWSFERVFFTFDEQHHLLKLIILSVDDRKQITATVEKSETYEKVLSYMKRPEHLQEYISTGSVNAPIYLPKEQIQLSRKTLVATDIEQPESFINALFSNPSLVTQNIREAYFTDGQRGMRILHEGSRLEFINPIQPSFDSINPMELLDKSITNINEHKGWTNDFLFENISSQNNIRYRLHYEGYPVFNRTLSTIEQEWRQQELYQYTRPLIRIGNLLNSREMELSSGEELLHVLTEDNRMEMEYINDIQVGYSLSYLEDAHTLTLEPDWYILYEGDWVKYDPAEQQQDLQVEGGG